MRCIRRVEASYSLRWLIDSECFLVVGFIYSSIVGEVKTTTPLAGRCRSDGQVSTFLDEMVPYYAQYLDRIRQRLPS